MMVRTFFYITIFFTFLISIIGTSRKLEKDHGWDRDIYCAATYIIEQKSNPYDTSQPGPLTGHAFSFTYPTGSYPILKLICTHSDLVSLNDDWSDFYIYFYVLVTLVGFLLLVSSKENYAYALTFFLTAFCTLSTNIITGNIGIVELFFTALSLFLFKKAKYFLAGFCIGYMASFKILPLIYLFPACFIFLLSNNQNDFKNRNFLYGIVGGLGAMISLSILISPDHYQYFLSTLIGTSGQHAPIKEVRPYEETPALILLLRQFFYNHYYPLSTVGFIYGVLLLGTCIFLYFYSKKEKNFISFLALSALALGPLFPRAKPYGFGQWIPYIYILSQNWKLEFKLVILIIACLIPTIHYFYPFHQFFEGFIKVIVSCSQSWLFLVTVAFVFYVHRLNRKKITI